MVWIDLYKGGEMAQNLCYVHERLKEEVQDWDLGNLDVIHT